MRIMARLKRAGRFYLNDYLLMIGYIASAIYIGTAIAVLSLGVAAHHVVEVLELVPNRWVTASQVSLLTQFYNYLCFIWRIYLI